MYRKFMSPRINWDKKVEADGLCFAHCAGGPYWTESMPKPVYYEFNKFEIAEIQFAAEVVHQHSLEAVDYVIRNNLMSSMDIPSEFHEMIKRSWLERDNHFYGRFDFSFNDDGIHLLEYNADTPTALLESSVVQWNWLQDLKEDGTFKSHYDQFNMIEEDIVDRFKFLKSRFGINQMHFSCAEHDFLEDETTTVYIMELAQKAGIESFFTYDHQIAAMCYFDDKVFFGDHELKQIRNIFLLKPWEDMFRMEYGKYIEGSGCRFFEPSWKSILSNKAILPILHKIAGDCKYIKKSFYNKDYFVKNGINYVEKPFFSREGDNIKMIGSNGTIEETGGVYANERKIYQEYCGLKNFDGNYPVLGVWVIGDKVSGMGIREDDSMITKDTSRFIPHIII